MATSTRRIVTYANKRNRGPKTESRLLPDTSPLEQPPSGNGPDDQLQSLESMRRRMLKRSRSSFSGTYTSSMSAPAADIEVAVARTSEDSIFDDSKTISSLAGKVQQHTNRSNAATERHPTDSSAYMSLPLETPLPTASRLSEAYRPPSGVGKSILPEDFSPMPRVPKHNRILADSTRNPVNRSSSKYDAKDASKGPLSKPNTKLARTKSGDLKENASDHFSQLPSNKAGKLPATNSRPSRRTRKSRRTHSIHSRPSSRSSFVAPLSSPFNSQPPSAAPSPKQGLSEKSNTSNIPPVKSKDGQFKVPLLPKSKSMNDQKGGDHGSRQFTSPFAASEKIHVPAYERVVQSTTTSPAHSAICAHSPHELDATAVYDSLKGRRPSAPSATRPSVASFFPVLPGIQRDANIRDETSNTLQGCGQVFDAGNSSWGSLGVCFDRPPSQLDYTHTYYLGGCELENMDSDLLQSNPSASDFSVFWNELCGASTPFDKKRQEADDEVNEEGETTIFPLASAPGYKTPELQLHSPPQLKPYLRSFFSDAGPKENAMANYFPAKEFLSPRSGKSYYSSPHVRECYSSPSDYGRRARGVEQGESGSGEDEDDDEDEEGMSWLSDSLISPPTALVRRLRQVERRNNRAIKTADKNDASARDGGMEDEQEGTMDMELDTYVHGLGPPGEADAPIVKEPLNASPEGLDDIFKSVNISLESLDEDGVGDDVASARPSTLDRTASHFAEPNHEGANVAQANAQNSISSQPTTNAISKGRSRRGTIRASDFPNTSITNNTASPGNTGATTGTRRTRSGTVTARSLGPPPISLVNTASTTSMGINGARRTRSGTVIGPPAAPPTRKASALANVGAHNSSGTNTPASSKSPGSALSSDPLDMLGPPIDLQDETWEVAPRVFSPLPRMRVVQQMKGGPRGGSRMGAFAMKLSAMRSLSEDERSSDDELLLKPSGGGTRQSYPA